MKPKILIVDDKEEDRLKLRAILKKEYTLEEAGSAQEALAKLRGKSGFDLVLLDVYMPDEKEVGFDVLQSIKKTNYKIKVIMVTIESRIHKAVAYLQNGAFNFVTKPFNAEVLLNLVKQALKDK
jgi:two-component system nitrogen regulation response regulator NtrX